MEFSSSTDFSLESFVITPHIGKKVEIKQLIANFVYSESITTPFLTATCQVVDSVGMINTLPIKGGELVQVKVLTALSDEPLTYNMKIWQVGNRFAEQKKQVYTLGLISEEAIINETAQVTVGTTGNPYSIIGNCIKTDLKSSKEFFGENSLFEVKMLPGLKRPFDFFTSLSIKSVSPQATFQNSKSENTNETTEEVKGSGGFFFWETYRGYNFYAIDSLLAGSNEKSKFTSPKLKTQAWGSKPDQPYTERLGNIGDGADDRFTIKRSVFGSEINLMEALRKGKLASKVAFFNHSTGQYSEYVYKLKKNYDNMSHLGGQSILSKIPLGSKDIGDYPSRNLSVLLDHETWFNEPGIASPEPEDGSENPTPYADWQKYFTVQTIARYQLLQNQRCTIVIPGNALMCAGDRINIRLVTKLPDELAKDQPYDLETSGEYLIGEVTHSYDPTMGNNGQFLTTLRLMRDSYGMKDKASAHST